MTCAQSELHENIVRQGWREQLECPAVDLNPTGMNWNWSLHDIATSVPEPTNTCVAECWTQSHSHTPTSSGKPSHKSGDYHNSKSRYEIQNELFDKLTFAVLTVEQILPSCKCLILQGNPKKNGLSHAMHDSKQMKKQNWLTTVWLNHSTNNVFLSNTEAAF